MLRALLDTNGVDPLIDQPGALESIEAAIERGKLELLIPPATVGEIRKTKIAERRRRLLDVATLAEHAPDGVFVIGRAAFGTSRFGDRDLFHRLGGENPNHINDARIAMAAHYEKAILVTNEPRLFKVSAAEGIPAMNTAALLDLVGYAAP